MFFAYLCIRNWTRVPFSPPRETSGYNSSYFSQVSLENIDFGETFEISQSTLCELPADFVKGISAELVKCDLHDVGYDATKHKNAPLTEALLEELTSQFQSICTQPTTSTSMTIVSESGSNVQSRRYSVQLKAVNDKNQVMNVNNHMKVTPLYLLLSGTFNRKLVQILNYSKDALKRVCFAFFDRERSLNTSG